MSLPSKSIRLPKQSCGHVIGSGGKNIRGIEQKLGCNVGTLHVDEERSLLHVYTDDDELVDEVEIEVQALLARVEETIVNEKRMVTLVPDNTTGYEFVKFNYDPAYFSLPENFQPFIPKPVISTPLQTTDDGAEVDNAVVLAPQGANSAAAVRHKARSDANRSESARGVKLIPQSEEGKHIDYLSTRRIVLREYGQFTTTVILGKQLCTARSVSDATFSPRELRKAVNSKRVHLDFHHILSMENYDLVTSFMERNNFHQCDAKKASKRLFHYYESSDGTTGAITYRELGENEDVKKGAREAMFQANSTVPFVMTMISREVYCPDIRVKTRLRPEREQDDVAVVEKEERETVVASGESVRTRQKEYQHYYNHLTDMWISLAITHQIAEEKESKYFLEIALYHNDWVSARGKATTAEHYVAQLQMVLTCARQLTSVVHCVV